jgi:hypothetical protein
MPVNPVTRTADVWLADDDPLVRQIHASPLVTVLEPGGSAVGEHPANG